MLPEGLLNILVCPACKSPLTERGDELICATCRVAYPVRDGIPVLLVGESRPLN